MTNPEAIKRMQEKLRYTKQLIAERPDGRANFYREKDCEAFELCISALGYTEAMQQYEASQK